MHKKLIILFVMLNFLIESATISYLPCMNSTKDALRPVAGTHSGKADADLSEELRRQQRYYALEWCEERLQAARGQYEAEASKSRLQEFDEGLSPYIENGLFLDDPEEVWARLIEEGIEATDTLEQVFILERKRQALIAVRKKKYNADGFINTIAVFDPGKYGYIVDTVGFPGSWRIGILAHNHESISTEGILRLAKSFAYIIDRINAGNQQVDPGLLPSDLSINNIYIVESSKDVDRFVPTGTQLWESAPGLYLQIDGATITVFATRSYLSVSRTLQRRTLRSFFEKGSAARSFTGNNGWRSNIEHGLQVYAQKPEDSIRRAALVKTGIIITDSLMHIFRAKGEGFTAVYPEPEGREEIPSLFIRELLFQTNLGFDNNNNANFEFWIERKYLEEARSLIREIRKFYHLPIIHLNIIEDGELQDIDMHGLPDVHLKVGCNEAVKRYVARQDGMLNGREWFFDMPDRFLRSALLSDTRIVFTKAYSSNDNAGLEDIPGVNLLVDALERRGYRVDTVDGAGFVTDAIAGYGTKNIYCLTTSLSNIKETQQLVLDIRAEDPNAFIIVGGPAASTPEHLLSNVEGIDILIRGEAEEILPRIVDIISSATTRYDLTYEQLAQLASLKGVYARSGRMIAVAGLNNTNFVDEIQLPPLKGPATSFARGCPYNCNFCSKLSGRHFRSASAEALIEHLIDKLALAVDLPYPMADKILRLFDLWGLTGQKELDGLKANNYIFRMLSGKWHIAPEDMVSLIEIFETTTYTDQYFLGWRFSLDDEIKAKIRDILRIAESPEGDIKAEIRSAATPFTRRMAQDIIFAFRRQWAEALIALNDKYDGDILAVDESGYIKGELLISGSGDESLAARKKLIAVAEWIKRHHFNRFMKIVAGQSSIASIYNFSKQRPDLEYMRRLKEANFHLSTFGIDGMTNHALDMHNKDGYRIGHVLECYVAGRRIGLDVEDNNNMTLNPFVTELDLAEIAALNALLPFFKEYNPVLAVHYAIGSSFGNENIILFPDKVLERNSYVSEGGYSEYNILTENRVGSLEPFHGVEVIESSQLDDPNNYEYRKLGREYLEGHEDDIIKRWREDLDPEMNSLAEIYLMVRKKYPGASAWKVIEEIKGMTGDITFEGRGDFGYFRHLLYLMTEDPDSHLRVSYMKIRLNDKAIATSA